MKIRIKTQRYVRWRKDIINRADNGEWETWRVEMVESVKKPNTFFKRLVHVPGGDYQYEDIQLKLCTPTKEEAILGIGYLDIVPTLRRGVNMEEEELHAKMAVVLGRFCEILNRYFPHLKSYSVVLK